MRSFAAILLVLPYVAGFPSRASDFRMMRRDDGPTTEVQGGQTGTLMVLPPQATETGLKQIPDADHPYIAPGADDQRGPCPAMNTLANHGYIPRNGIATFEEISLAIMEAFNLELLFGANMIANNMLTRGNTFMNKVSIGGVSPLIPPLPGMIDGPETGGIVKHGRFEGDASMTRSDFLIGDNRNFQDILYDYLLLALGKYGDNGPDGNNTVFNMETILAIKNNDFIRDQAANPGFEFAARRMNTAYLEAAFILDVFANGTTGQATLPIISSFFRNQTFPKNWFRAASPVTAESHRVLVRTILNGLGYAPGRNNEEGIYVADPPPPAPYNGSFGCASYYDQAGNIPAVLVNTTGIFKKNVDLLSAVRFTAISGEPCSEIPPLPPFGPADT